MPMVGALYSPVLASYGAYADSHPGLQAQSIMFSFLLKHFNHIWFAIVGAVLVFLLAYPDWLSRESISDFLNGLGAMAFLAYILVTLTRAMIMLPCTPFVLAGGISFPQWPLPVLLISVAGVVIGAWLVYSFPSFGNYDEYLEEKFPDKIAVLKDRMNGPYAFWIVAGWSFFPLVPTDAVCYVGGMVKMSLKKMTAALLVGELPLIMAYIYLGAEIGEWLRI